VVGLFKPIGPTRGSVVADRLRSHRRHLAGALLTLLGLFVVLSPVRNALADLVAQPGPPPPLQVVTSPGDPTGSPVDSGASVALTAPESSTALQIVRQDPALQRLLAGAPYQVEDVGPWTTRDSQGLLGVAVLLHLSRPTTISGSWPSAVYDTTEGTTPPYTATSADYAATGVQELMVEVALPQNVVVDVRPTDSVSLIPGFNYKAVFGRSRAQTSSRGQG